MALTLFHEKFKDLIESISGVDAYPVYFPETASAPALVYSMINCSRDIESNLKDTTVSAHTFQVTVAAEEYLECHTRTQTLINTLDQYTDISNGFLLTLVEDASDGFDPDLSLFTITLLVSVRVREQ